MADKASYLQIPSTVWWGLRALLRTKPNATIDDKYLAVNLGVQLAASRQYVSELKRAGLLSDDSKATELAMRWRNDETYREAADQIIENSYPDGLRDVAPPGAAERSKVISWFMHNGLGEGTARNKAGTYLMIANDGVQDAPDGKQKSKPSGTNKPVASATPAPQTTKTRPPSAHQPSGGPAAERGGDAIPLNVNVQIHISADASTDQIEAIFSSMRRYLRNEPAT
jgi:hypothetical protein